MAMPKKGRRQIVVGDHTYYYSIKPYIRLGSTANGGRLTVELKDGKYTSKEFTEAVTPSMVEEFINDSR